MTKQEAYRKVEKLAERFDYHIEEYKKGIYNETQTRNDYINPFFEALGWDINNRQGLAESYREVIHEDRIKISGSSKAPDYCFTIYGQKKFFVEAKKPSVNIKEHSETAYQLRRYGWSAKMPISIITDFEEFSIYDCTGKPTLSDNASVFRVKYLTYKDYLKEFDFLWETFSKEMVLKGSFDRFVASSKGKRGTAGVDAEFLKTLDSWRDLLARNIVNRNKNIYEDELNFALQKIMDRLIFLRICEDRGIEEYEQLKNQFGTNIYERLKYIFHLADQKYNSGLFDYHNDTITDTLSIDDKILKTIIEEMYYPKSPYEFSVIPVEILGHSYEQYLGKVIRITQGHIIKIEEKPEVRKAGGVYYTPQYIVDYIVKNTVGRLLNRGQGSEVEELEEFNTSYNKYFSDDNERNQELQVFGSWEGSNELDKNNLGADSNSSGTVEQSFESPQQKINQSPITTLRSLTPEDVAKIKICDPACGSGSFLLGAYQYLLDWHRNYYINTDIKNKDKYLTPEGNLTTSVKKQILLNNIYGVDIDTNAVEVTKLSLMLKALENETQATINNQLQLFHQRVLPSLDNNIKCGNSLIDMDFYDSQIEFTPNIEKKIKPFNWERAFPDVFEEKEIKEDLKAYHITWVTFNSRPVGENNIASSLILDEKSRNEIAKYLDEKVGIEKYRIIAINVLNDHVHCIVVCTEEQHPKIVAQLKGSSSFYFHRNTDNISQRVNPVVDKSQYSDRTINKLWASDYSHTFLNDEKHILNAMNYIEYNHQKHNLPPLQYKFKNLTPLSNAFQPRKEQGGFDVVIGNPPYVRIQTMTEYLPPSVINYYKTKFYSGKAGNIDIYVVFIEKAYNLINKNGLLGFIMPHKFFQSDFGVSIREFLSERKAIDRIIHFGANQIFENATTYTCLIFLNKMQNEFFDFLQIDNPKQWSVNISDYKTFKVKQPKRNEKWNFTDNRKQALLDKLNSMPLKLKDITRKIFQGIATSADKIYVLRIIEVKEETYRCFSVSLNKEIEIEKGLVKPFLMGKDVKRYENLIPKNVVIFPYLVKEGKALLMGKEYIKEHFPLGWEYILENKKALEERERGKFLNTWWQFSRPQNLTEFEVKKIITPYLGDKPQFTYDEMDYYHTTKAYSIAFNNKAIENEKLYLGLLNSSLFLFYIKNTGTVFRGGFFVFATGFINPFPIPQSPPSDISSQLTALVETMLQLHKDLHSATLPEQKEHIQARINYTDKKIDQLVYELYGLTEEEIKIIEGK